MSESLAVGQVFKNPSHHRWVVIVAVAETEVLAAPVDADGAPIKGRRTHIRRQGDGLAHYVRDRRAEQ